MSDRIRLLSQYDSEVGFSPPAPSKEDRPIDLRPEHHKVQTSHNLHL